MSNKAILKKAARLAEWIEDMQETVQMIKSDKYVRMVPILKTKQHNSKNLTEKSWFNSEEAWKQMKHFFIANIEQKIEETKTELDKLVIVKEEK